LILDREMAWGLRTIIYPLLKGVVDPGQRNGVVTEDVTDLLLEGVVDP
jgi:hypothetical protein